MAFVYSLLCSAFAQASMLIDAITILIPQEQYMFVYNAVRELLLLGDTAIKASDLKNVITQLKSKSEGKNSYQQQFAVSGSLLQNICT